MGKRTDKQLKKNIIYSPKNFECFPHDRQNLYKSDSSSWEPFSTVTEQSKILSVLLKGFWYATHERCKCSFTKLPQIKQNITILSWDTKPRRDKRLEINNRLLAHCTVQSHRNWQIFQRCLLPPCFWTWEAEILPSAQDVFSAATTW